MLNIKKRLKKKLKDFLKSDTAVNCISSLIYWYTRLVYHTTSWQIQGREKPVQLWEEGKDFILIGWHGRALMLPAFRDYRFPLNALVSLHNDGRMIAGVLQKYGLGTIGGSSNNNARGAALNLMSSLQNDTSICIIPDGPRGPRMHLSLSPVYYAKKTGKPIIGMTYSTKRNKIIESAWDKMMIPYPFNKGICCFTEPFYVPADATDDELENYRLEIEKKLNNLNYGADKKMGIPPTKPGNKIKNKNDRPTNKGN